MENKQPSPLVVIELEGGVIANIRSNIPGLSEAHFVFTETDREVCDPDCLTVVDDCAESEGLSERYVYDHKLGAVPLSKLERAITSDAVQHYERVRLGYIEDMKELHRAHEEK